MKTKMFFLLSLVIPLTLIISPLVGKASASKLTSEQKQADTTTAFVNVNVIPMDTERVLENQTVIIEGGRITTIGPAAEVTISDGVEIIEGNGAYLMPGLADMHVHLDFDSDPDYLRLFLAQGITTVRNLNGIQQHFEWREQVATGNLFGPTILTSGNGIYGVPSFLNGSVLMFRVAVVLGPVVLGLLIWLFVWLIAKFTPLVSDFGRVRRYFLPSLFGLLIVGGLMALLRVIPLSAYLQLSYPFVSAPESEAEARQMVREQKTTGANFIKPYDWESRDIYFAVLDEAEKQGIYTAGHLVDTPEYVTLEEMVAAGQDEVVHADEFMSYLFVGFDPENDGWVEYEVDMSRIEEIATLMVNNDVALCSTLITNETVLLGLEDIGILDGPAYKVVRPELLEEWRTVGRIANWQGQEEYRRSAWRPALMALTKAMNDKGALVTVGTDVTVEGIVPGYSAHLELPLLVESGLTNFEALAAGTRNAALVAGRMGADSAWGMVAVGNRADLILLPNNPLEDVTNTQDRLGVMIRGQWFTQAELDALVDEFTASYSAMAAK